MSPMQSAKLKGPPLITSGIVEFIINRAETSTITVVISFTFTNHVLGCLPSESYIPTKRQVCINLYDLHLSLSDILLVSTLQKCLEKLQIYNTRAIKMMGLRALNESHEY